MKKKKLFALIDCNNFYASCERLFRPELNGKPIVVLSNNDGCIIARSNEAKALGIKMAEPYFKVEPFLRRHRVHVFSSNYALYGDLSQRVMSTLHSLEPEVEVYSIDEAFVRLPYTDRDSVEAYARDVQQRVQQDTGISVSIGIAASKTLAKAANFIAKKSSSGGGVLGALSPAEIEKMLASLKVGNVWGVGRRSAEKLANCGVVNALELSHLSDYWLRRNLTVTGLRTATELRGISCIALDKAPLNRKSVLSSRSFKYPVRSLLDLKEAVATYVSTAAEKLRTQKLAASCLNVFLRTNTHQKDRAQYENHCTISLAEPTSHNRPLIKAAMQGLEEIYRAGYQFQKAGVMLTGLVADNCRQQNLFGEADDDSLMRVFDQINNRWGRNTLQYAAAGFSKPWSMRQSHKSPAYTTSWQDLPVVGG